MTAERAIAQEVEVSVRQEQEHNEADNSKFGFIVFLLSETVIFLSFFVGYIVYKTTAIDWYPLGVTGLEVSAPRLNTIVLVSSSFVIYVAERYLHDKNYGGLRFFLLATIAMGSYFLYGQAVEWRSLTFGFTSGLFGGTFYLLTGFHGLHVLTGILLQTLMLARSFLPGNYDNGFLVLKQRPYSGTLSMSFGLFYLFSFMFGSR